MSDQFELELNFPCEYPVKVIGLNENDFAAFAKEIITRHIPGLPAEAYLLRNSSAGKYLSISVTFIAQSRAQIDGLYKELGAHKRVLIAM